MRRPARGVQSFKRIIVLLLSEMENVNYIYLKQNRAQIPG